MFTHTTPPPSPKTHHTVASSTYNMSSKRKLTKVEKELLNSGTGNTRVNLLRKAKRVTHGIYTEVGSDSDVDSNDNHDDDNHDDDNHDDDDDDDDDEEEEEEEYGKLTQF